MIDQRLLGKRAFVAGAAGAIGSAVVERLRGSGARVACADLPGASNVSRLSAGADEDDARWFPMDVADPGDTAAAVADAVRWLGGLDIAVNCAGIHRSSAPLELTEAEWDDVLDVNLKGTFFVCQAAGRAMKDSGGGAIVNITSVMAEVALGDLAHYAASKGGVRQLTKALAVGLAGSNIRVNAVGPGPVESAMNAAALATPAARDAVLARVAMRRPGQAAEIAAVVSFLASEDAAFITGTTIYVDGGLLAQR